MEKDPAASAGPSFGLSPSSRLIGLWPSVGAKNDKQNGLKAANICPIQIMWRDHVDNSRFGMRKTYAKVVYSPQMGLL